MKGNSCIVLVTTLYTLIEVSFLLRGRENLGVLSHWRNSLKELFRDILTIKIYTRSWSLSGVVDRGGCSHGRLQCSSAVEASRVNRRIMHCERDTGYLRRPARRSRPLAKQKITARKGGKKERASSNCSCSPVFLFPPFAWLLSAVTNRRD